LNFHIGRENTYVKNLINYWRTALMDRSLLIKLLKTMLKIRIFEEKVVELYGRAEIKGDLHSYIGEEAVATGVCLNLSEEDYITSTHRGHGHCIAKGVNIKNMMAELFAKETGCCKARGGSMHIADVSKGVLSANGIVGGGIPIATGAALSCQYQKNGRITVCFFGDGAADQGGFHESLNLASLWKLPIIFLCENNLYAQSNHMLKHMNIENISDRSKAYNIQGIIIDGMNVLNVYKKMNTIIKDVRNNKGPVLVEAKTYRYRGHWEGDPILYRTKDEVEVWKKKDPINRLVKEMSEDGILKETDVLKIKSEISVEVDEAIDFARKSPNPLKESAMDYIYYDS